MWSAKEEEREKSVTRSEDEDASSESMDASSFELTRRGPLLPRIQSDEMKERTFEKFDEAARYL